MFKKFLSGIQLGKTVLEQLQVVITEELMES